MTIDKQALDEIDRFLLTFCASCEYFDGNSISLDLKDDSICKKYSPNLFRKAQSHIMQIINKAREE